MDSRFRGKDGGEYAPSPQPSPIKGEGEANPTWMDNLGLNESHVDCGRL